MPELQEITIAGQTVSDEQRQAILGALLASLARHAEIEASASSPESAAQAHARRLTLHNLIEAINGTQDEFQDAKAFIAGKPVNVVIRRRRKPASYYG